MRLSDLLLICKPCNGAEISKILGLGRAQQTYNATKPEQVIFLSRKR